MKKIDKELEIKIIELYEKGLSCRGVAKELNNCISETTVFNVLKRNNIPRRTKGGVARPKPEELIADYFEHNLTTTEISEKYKISKWVSREMIRESGYELKNQTFYHNPNFDENYFETIDTEAKAYFVGLILTDGNVCLREQSSACISLTLQIGDHYMIERLKQEWKTNNVVSIDTRKDGRQTSTIKVHSDKMKEDLAKFSIVPNKTHKTFLPIIDKQYMRHLIRGMIDGDGYIGYYPKQEGRHEHHVIALTGRPHLLEQFRNYLVKELGINNNKVTVGGNGVGVIKWSSKQDIKTLKNYLYSDATIYLTRKFDKLSNVQ